MDATEAVLKKAAAELETLLASLTIPDRALIVAETYERPLSPAEFAKTWGLDLTKVSRHFRALADAGYIELVAESANKVGGGRRSGLYRATQSLLFRTEEWEDFSLKEREGHTFVVFVTFVARLSQALNAGTFDMEKDRHFTWKPMKLDRQGWAELMTRLDDFFDAAVEIEVAAAMRMRESNEEPIPTTLGLAGFRSPWARELTLGGLTRKEWPQDKQPGARRRRKRKQRKDT